MGFLGMGSYVPEKIMTNYDLEKLVDTSNEWIVERTGIRQRHIAAPEQATSDLAFIAAQRALDDANLKAEDLDLIVVASESPDMKFPSVACMLQDRLGASHAAAFDLGAGCTGFAYACGIVSQTIASGFYKHVLVVGAETLSRILDFTDRNTCILFGDGAGAAILGPVEDGYGILSVDLGADGSGGKYLNMPGGGSRHPASHETVDHHEHFIHMNGKEVFKFAVRVLGRSVMKALDKIGMTKNDIDLLVPHQANVRIIDSAAKRLDLPLNKVMVNVDQYANTSAASIPIALCDARDQGRLKRDEIVVLVGFGAGLTYGSLVIKWQKTEEAKKMSKIAFMFPGQGSQKVGMMKDLYDNYSVVKDVFKEADEALGFSMTDLCFKGPEEQLRLTYNTQPAILTCSVAAMKVLEENEIVPSVVAGHSLGEYSALVCAGAMSFADAVRTVRKRGQFMQEAVPVGEGAMAAIIGLDTDKIKEICAETANMTNQCVQAVNFNCPGQIVIAGATEAVHKACDRLKEAGAKRAILLPVSAPFHSTLMQPAADRLKEVLDSVEIVDAKIPVVANVNAKPETKADEIRSQLVLQAASPVLWEDSVRRMMNDGVDTFVEVGPGKVLCGFIKKVDRSYAPLNVEDMESLEKSLAYLKEVR